MAQFIRRSGGVYDEEEPDSPLVPQGNQRLETASEQAQSTLDNIDNVLADEEEARDLDRTDIAQQEQAGDTLGQGYTSSGSTSSGAGAESPKGLKDSEDASKGSDDLNFTGGNGRRQGWMNRRRAGIAGILVSIGVGGVIGLGGIGSGLPWLHLSQFWQEKNHAQQSNNASGRFGRLWRWAKTGDISQTRLSWLGSRKAASLDAKFAAKGITTTRNSLGYVSKMVIDASKTDEYKGLGKDAAKAAIERDFGKLGATVQQISGLGDGKFVVSGPPGESVRSNWIDMKVTWAKVKSLELGKIATGLAFRNEVKRGLITLSPIKALDKKINSTVAEKYNKWLEDKNQRIKSLSSKWGEKLSSFKSSSTGKIAGAAATGVAAFCIARGIYNGIGDANYAAIVMPTMKIAGDTLGSGDQTALGGDIDTTVLSFMDKSLEEKDANGKVISNIDQSMAYKAAAGQQGGIDMPQDTKTGYSTAGNSFDFLNREPVTSACTGVTGGLVFVASIGLGVITGGLITTITGAVVGGAAIAGLQALVVNIASSEPVKSTPAGALLGNYIAYGDRALSNDAIIGMGGGVISAQEDANQVAQATADAKKEFESKSLAYRLFNATDRRSLIASVIDEQAGKSTSSTLASLGTGIFGLGGSVASSFGKIAAPSAYAAPVPYDYGFPKYGFSTADIASPIVDNPYENADIVAGLVKSDPSLADKVKTCFGVTLDQGAHGLEVNISHSQDDMINPFSKEYNPDECASDGGVASTNGSASTKVATSQTSNSPSIKLASATADTKITGRVAAASTDSANNWLRVRMFIFDSRIMDSYTCGDGDDADAQDACTRIGADYIDSTSASTGSTSTTPTGTAGYGATAEQLQGLPAACQNGTATGNILLLCVGAKYRNLVPYLAVHNYTGKQFSEMWASGKRDGLTLDCSLFVGTALYDAFGIDFTTTSQEYYNPQYFDKITDISQAQPGDIAVSDGHIVLVNEPGKTVLDTGWTHPTSPVNDLNIHQWLGDYYYLLRYKGPTKATPS